MICPGEELWVIERTDPNLQIRPGDDDPGTGALMARQASKKDVPLPLQHTDVKAHVSAWISSVDVTQRFHNPFDDKIEAVYVFPLPVDAAVSEFVMTIGERHIRGIIREREEARKIYEEAKSQGYVASLLSQERPNVFTQSVANIEPGKSIDVSIRYFHTLAYVDGGFEFVFPMVVGPRFNPPGSTQGVGAVARGDHGASRQATEVQYLKPVERSGHDIALSVEIDAGVAIEEIACSSHAIAKESPAPEKAKVTLSPNDRIPNKDFVLRCKVAGASVKSSLLAHRDKRGGFFTLMLVPPADLATLRRRPVELVFVLDCSGSMQGAPLAKAKGALERALKRLEPDDTFQIVRFSNSASALGPAPLPATPANVRRGLDYLASLQSEGGTMMLEGIRAALDFPRDPDRLRVVSFMTDGYIGNEMEIFAEVRKRLGAARIFSFGVGSSVNRYLLEGLARIGRGAVAFVGLDDAAGAEVDRFYERIRRPALSDITVDWGGLEVSDVYPHRIPDLVVGRPVLVTGRFAGAEPPRSVRIRGQSGGEASAFDVSLRPDGAAGSHPAIPLVWARAKIAELSDFAVVDPEAEYAGLARKTALEFGLVSAYTSFLAVDASRRTEGDHGTTVPVAVPVPDGVKYETTVKENK